MNSYQKLKKQNQELKQDLIKISCDSNSQEAYMIKKKWKMIAAMEYSLYYAKMYEKNNFNGVLNKVK